MFPLFAGIIQLLKKNSANTDNFVFKLHYKVTATLLISFSIILTAKQLVGDPISCMGAKNSDVPEKVLNDFCWIQTTFTEFKNKAAKRNEISYGVGTFSEGSEVRYHSYYQWVCLVLFIQSLAFYLPKYIWTIREGHLIKSLTTDINLPIVEKNFLEKRVTQLRKCFCRQRHAGYVRVFIFCEFLNLVNIFWQIVFLDYFLYGEFTKYGWNVLKFTETDSRQRDDPMNIVFPKVTKCTFNYFGSSGTKQNIEALCVMPLNIVNEKIFIFLWMWFFVLLSITGLQIMFRVMIICSKFVRHFTLKTRAPMSTRPLAKMLSDRLDLGDWFLLYQLGENVYAAMFEDIMEAVLQETQEKGSVSLKKSNVMESNKTICSNV